VLALVAFAVVFVVFISGEIEWGGRVRIHALFHHTGELREGAPVIVAGREIGSIETIALSPKGAPGPLLGEPGVDVTLVLSSAEARRVARGGDVFVAGRGPLAARHLEIAPSPTPDGPTFADNQQPIRGIDPPTIDRVLQRTWENLMIAKRFVDEIAPEFGVFRDELRTLAKTMDGLVPNVVGVASLGIEVEGLFAEAKKLRAALGGDQGLERIAGVIGHARATIAQARRLLDTLDAKAKDLTGAVAALRGRIDQRGPAVVSAVELAITRLRAAIDKIDPLLATVQDLNARIARGEGTIGKLTRDPEFPEDAKELGKIMKRQPWRIFMRPKD
jgi:ABC-type transporter Mla subunit MlaD